MLLTRFAKSNFLLFESDRSNQFESTHMDDLVVKVYIPQRKLVDLDAVVTVDRCVIIGSVSLLSPSYFVFEVVLNTLWVVRGRCGDGGNKEDLCLYILVLLLTEVSVHLCGRVHLHSEKRRKEQWVKWRWAGRRQKRENRKERLPSVQTEAGFGGSEAKKIAFFRKRLHHSFCFHMDPNIRVLF